VTIEELLTKIADLLDAHGEADWAQAFRNFLSDYKNEPDLAKGKIRSVYGGMGSFNDIILHGPNGIPLRDENDDLDLMRSDLFELCR
jgi:hypothetical protein